MGGRDEVTSFRSRSWVSLLFSLLGWSFVLLLQGSGDEPYTSTFGWNLAASFSPLPALQNSRMQSSWVDWKGSPQDPSTHQVQESHYIALILWLGRGTFVPVFTIFRDHPLFVAGQLHSQVAQ